MAAGSMAAAQARKGAAANQILAELAGNLAGKRRMRPRALVSGRHNVGMPGEQKVGPSRADARMVAAIGTLMQAPRNGARCRTPRALSRCTSS